MDTTLAVFSSQCNSSQTVFSFLRAIEITSTQSGWRQAGQPESFDQARVWRPPPWLSSTPRLSLSCAMLSGELMRVWSADITKPFPNSYRFISRARRACARAASGLGGQCLRLNHRTCSPGRSICPRSHPPSSSRRREGGHRRPPSRRGARADAFTQRITLRDPSLSAFTQPNGNEPDRRSDGRSC